MGGIHVSVTVTEERRTDVSHVAAYTLLDRYLVKRLVTLATEPTSAELVNQKDSCSVYLFKLEPQTLLWSGGITKPCLNRC